MMPWKRDLWKLIAILWLVLRVRYPGEIFGTKCVQEMVATFAVQTKQYKIANHIMKLPPDRWEQRILSLHNESVLWTSCNDLAKQTSAICWL